MRIKAELILDDEDVMKLLNIKAHNKPKTIATVVAVIVSEIKHLLSNTPNALISYSDLIENRGYGRNIIKQLRHKLPGYAHSRDIKPAIEHIKNNNLLYMVKMHTPGAGAPKSCISLKGGAIECESK